MDGRRDVPEAVLFDILLFLPVISLLRFKAVCKSWHSIIESPTFITQQLNSTSEKNNLIVYNNKGMLSMLSGRNHEVCANLNLEGISTGINIVGSCNGILCLAYEYSNRYWRISLWNPATKQARQLPESSYFSEHYKCSSNYFALGFDVKTNDYKIVSISLDQHRNTMNGSLVQVHNMRIDSWRTIHEGNDFPITWINTSINAVCKNEMCLWIAGSSTVTEDTLFPILVFYFDLAEEVYGTMPLPDDRKSVNKYSLAFVNEKITYIEWNYETRSCCYYEIWTMNEFGTKESWAKLYKLKEPASLSCHFVDQLYLSKNGDFILVSKVNEDDETDIKYEVYLYYLGTGEVKKLDVLDVYNVKNYTESMVPVKSREETS